MLLLLLTTTTTAISMCGYRHDIVIYTHIIHPLRFCPLTPTKRNRGVNLPAHTVIIKGTELYDPERGGFVDVSILDILQIFGRAGRPQYDTSGHAILITSHASMGTYLGLLGQQAPIESSLIKSLADHMNAEIVNGTINNIKEAQSWLSYTFLFIRMCKNPIAYGILRDERHTDPQLEKKRLELVSE